MTLHAVPTRFVPATGLVVVLTLGGCGFLDRGAPSPDTAALVGDDTISLDELADYVAREVGVEPEELEPQVRSALLDQMLDERLLVELALERGLLDRDDVGRREAVAALVAADPPQIPSETEVAAAYREDASRWRLPEQVHLAQILVQNRARAERAVEEIAQGQAFEEVARRHSEDPSAPYGGDQGQLAYDDLPDGFRDAIFDLEAGETSGIVEADYGFHIFRVTERTPGRTVPLDEAAPMIRERLREEATDRRVDELVDAARSQYTVRVYAENLPFEYRGEYGEPTDENS